MVEFYCSDNSQISYYNKFKNNNNKSIGFIHGTQIGRYNDDIFWLSYILDAKSNFIKNIHKFICLFTFSEYVQKFLIEKFKEMNIEIDVHMVHHPTNFNVEKYDLSELLNSNNKKIIQLGQQLRHHSTIYEIDTSYKKSWLPGTKNKDAHSYLKSLIAENIPNITKEKLDSVDVHYFENYKNYDDFLKESIILLNFVDANANNSIVESIVKNMPVITNIHPAVEEYLGKDYPLYFSNSGEISTLLNDTKISEAYEYLLKLDESKLNMSHFMDHILSELRKSI